MTFLISDSFTDSLARLTGEEQKAVKTTAFDLQMDPSSPGLSFHKLDRAKDKRFWSVRVNQDIRLIVHRSDTSLLLCYADHHDRAYAWAERRKLETHPVTGAAQMVELRESVREIVVPAYVQEAPQERRVPPPLAGIAESRLLEFGVPAEWIADLKSADEDGLLSLVEHLPSEAMEAVLQLATGGTPARIEPQPVEAFSHPDAQRRFRVVTNVEELARALDAPWDKWAVFLHPEQRQLVSRDFTGPARVTGSAGTGKTVVALHRAVHLARSRPDARVLLATFSPPLAHALHANVRRLIGHEPRLQERLEVHALPELAVKLYRAQFGSVSLVHPTQLNILLHEAAEAAGERAASRSFLRTEWDHVVDAWNLRSWEAYRDVTRLGRRTRLPESRRAALWKVFDAVREALRQRSLLTESMVFHALADAQLTQQSPAFDAAVIDEAQDVGVAQLRFLAALTGHRPNGLFFTGDLGQRIFQQPFSWKALGIDIRGRSRTLRVNYRTSHQIRQQADRLLSSESVDADGSRDTRRNTVSVFNGPKPAVVTFESTDAERAAVAAWLKDVIAAGTQPHEIGVFVRSENELPRALGAVKAAGGTARPLDERVVVARGEINVATMSLAKGLEFRAVAVIGCDDEVLPLQARIESVGDDGDLDEVYDTERQLLYVACTRARDQLFVSGVEPASEFLDDFRN